MPSTMGYVRGSSSQGVYYPPSNRPRGFAKNQGSGSPMRNRSEQIRRAMRRRGMLRGITVMPQAGGVAKTPSGSRHHDRGQPPTNASVTRSRRHSSARSAFSRRRSSRGY